MFNPPIYRIIYGCVLFVSARNLVKHATRCVTKARVAAHIYQPPDTTIINNNNNRYNVIRVYTRVGVTYIILLLLYYIVYIYYTCDRVQ